MEARLGATGAYTAACRALEAERDDRVAPLFRDPLARAFAGPQGFAFVDAVAGVFAPEGDGAARAGVRRALADAVACRTAFVDAAIERAVKGGARQVVILGSGGDARAWRLACLAEATVFEADLPAVMRRRAEATPAGLEPLARRVVSLPMDVGAAPRGAVAARLAATGFDASAPSVWVLEGLLMYLTAARGRELLAEIASCGPGRASVCGDVLNGEFVHGQQCRPLLDEWARHGAPPVCGTDKPEADLRGAGFPLVRVLEFGEPGADFGRVAAENKRAFLEQNPRGMGGPSVPRNFLFEGCQ